MIKFAANLLQEQEVLQSFIEYLRHKEAISTSKVTDKEVESLAKSMTASMWEKQKKHLGL